MKEPGRIEEVDPARLEGLLARVKTAVSAEDYALLEKIVGSLLWLTRLVRAHGTTIGRLRRLVGGSRSEKTSAVIPAQAPGGRDPEDPDGTGGGVPRGGAGVASGEGMPSGGSTPERAKVKGHGRLASTAYPDAEHIQVPHECLRVGQGCPDCARGTLFAMAEPAQFLRIIGQAPLTAFCWDCQRLRCSACGVVYTARAPEEAQGDKYDATAVSAMAVLGYGLGVPFHRLEQLQADLRTPVPASTQWEAIEKRVDDLAPVHEEFVRQAAQSATVYIDDTMVRILELLGKRRAKLVAMGALEDPERTGLHTTAVVCVTPEGHTIALLRSGRKHAGENLADLLDGRPEGLPPPIQMSDALACNTVKGHHVVNCRCLVHGRRNFVDVHEGFPDEVRTVLQRLAEVFAIDEECRKKALTDQERLETHQQRSAPIMDALKAWMQEHLDDKRVEPNSGLGKAFRYMLRRWNELTAFLRVVGAPLSNNIVERLLKKAIRRRRNSLFFRTQRGAEVADLYMSLIFTAQLQGENPFEYLTALLRHPRQVAQRPGDWLPWTFRETLRRRQGPAEEPLSRAA